jgi:streptogramin lyase
MRGRAHYEPMPRARRSLPLLAIAVALAAWPAGAGAVPSVTEFTTGLSVDPGPTDIVAADDGNLWFTEQNGNGGIGSITLDGQITEFPALLTPGLSALRQPTGIAAGPDGRIWFTELAAPGAIAALDPDAGPSGQVTEYSSGLTANSAPTAITPGPDGNLWFTEKTGDRIGRICPQGTIAEFGTGLTAGSQPQDIVAGPDGNLWFTESGNPGRIGRIDTDGIITEFSAGLTPNSGPSDIVAGPDGNLWFTESGNPGRVGRITPEGDIAEFSAGLTPASQPSGIAEGGDGELWFGEAGGAGGIGRLTDGGITEFAGGVVLSLTAGAMPLGLTQGPDGNVWFAENATPGRIGQITVPPGVLPKAAVSIQPESATLKAKVRANAQPTTYSFEYGHTTAYGQQTVAESAGGGMGFGSVNTPIVGLTPGTEYHFRVVATNAAGTTLGADVTFGTPDLPGASAPSADPHVGASTDAVAVPSLPPVLGQAVVVRPLKGNVTVRRPRAARFAPLAAGERVPVGSLVDTRRGTVELTSARNGSGATQTGQFWGGVFQVRQTRSGHGVTDLVLRRGSFAGCRAGAARASVVANASARRRTVRRLWGKDSHSRFRTHGRDSVATVRGTSWMTADRCDGTITRVTSGKVSVRDLRRHRSVLLTAGRSYLARHRR